MVVLTLVELRPCSNGSGINTDVGAICDYAGTKYIMNTITRNNDVFAIPIKLFDLPCYSKIKSASTEECGIHRHTFAYSNSFSRK